MRFKKVYIEITNGCNLNCSFCIGNKRKVQFLDFNQFKIILDKIKPYTNYVYFHILGEPLLHPKINEFINYAHDNGFFVNITTNGYLINRIKNNLNIRQINISLHSYDPVYGLSLINYLDNIFNAVDLFDNTYISLRMWVDSVYHELMLSYILKRYNLSCIDNKVKKNVFLSYFHEFIWPDLSNNYYSLQGNCYGLIDHIGILSDGTIVPCCLDSGGDINLGNIFTDDLEDVLNNERVISMINGFKNGYKCEELCRHCNFLENK